MLGEYIFFVVSLAIAILDLGALDGVVDNIWQAKKIVMASNALAAIDFRAIGGYPMVLLGDFFTRYGGGVLSIGAYNLMTLLLSAFLIYAIFLRQSLARRFLLFFFITQVIALPFWFAVPALSPYNFYTGGISPQEVSASAMTQFSAYHPSAILITELSSAEQRQSAAGSGYRDLTNFPSMHAAWGIGLVYFGVTAFGAAAAYVLVPWFIFEMAGALYTGEHYAIDLLAGILVACIALWIIDRLLDLEKRYYQDKTSFAILAMMRKDMEWIKKWAGKFCRRARSFLGNTLLHP
jgi:membrane-associated phospholipid phosphatase